MKKVAVITGSAKGIGRATIEKFASLGYDVIIHYNNSEKEAILLKEKVEKEYNIEALLIKADLSKEEEINKMVEKIKEKYDHIDTLVNNAAFCLDTLYEEKTKENMLKTYDINVVAPFLLVKYLSPYMEGGSIINVSSINGIDTYFPMCLDYDASKSALISLTHNLALQYSPNIRVNAVAPGFIGTESELDGMDEEFIKLEEEKIFLKRIGKPEEVANVIAFLAGNESSYINNTIIRVDGGHYS